MASVTVAITGIGADFTRLESFGKVDAFAETLVSCTYICIYYLFIFQKFQPLPSFAVFCLGSNQISCNR